MDVFDGCLVKRIPWISMRDCRTVFRASVKKRNPSTVHRILIMLRVEHGRHEGASGAHLW
eukprot:scaffold967_cov161-Amphora_coffeaeformis.AAC.3